MPKVDVRAAGGLVWRTKGKTTQVLIIHRPRWNDWSIPKGKVKGSETLQECAIRELKEETGYDVALGAPIGWQRYKLANGQRKEVRFWVARPVASKHRALKARAKAKTAPKHEVDGVRWVSIAQAKKLLTTKADRETLAKMEKLQEKGLHDTVPLVLTRHARAKKRSAWKSGKDAEQTRPLTNTGQARARALVGVLAAYGVERVVSSPWKRCVDTVRPYTAASGFKLEKVEALTEAAHEKKPGGVRHEVARTLRKELAPTVFCLHRPTLPTVLETVEEFTPKAKQHQIPKLDPWLRTGESIVAQVAARRGKDPVVVAFEKVRPIID